MGLWEACFNHWTYFNDYNGKIYDGCWWIYSYEYRPIFHWINPCMYNVDRLTDFTYTVPYTCTAKPISYLPVLWIYQIFMRMVESDIYPKINSSLYVWDSLYDHVNKKFRNWKEKNIFLYCELGKIVTSLNHSEIVRKRSSHNFKRYFMFV